MTKKLLRFSGYLIVFTLLVWALHFGLGRQLSNAASNYFDLWRIYLFLALVTFIGYICLLFIHTRDATKTGFAYIGIGFLKMLASVLFLYPLIASKPDTIMTDVLSFFVPYFLFLAFELYFVVRLLAKN